jgi:hypothetical protein
VLLPGCIQPGNRVAEIGAGNVSEIYVSKPLGQPGRIQTGPKRD